MKGLFGLEILGWLAGASRSGAGWGRTWMRPFVEERRGEGIRGVGEAPMGGGVAMQGSTMGGRLAIQCGQRIGLANFHCAVQKGRGMAACRCVGYLMMARQVGVCGQEPQQQGRLEGTR